MDQHTTLNNLLDGKIKKDFSIAPYTTFKMGGKVDYFFEAQSDDSIINAYNTAKKLAIPFTFLGGASNTVIGHDIKGLVVRNTTSYKEIIEEESDHVVMRVSSGYIINRLVRETTEAGLSGFEYHLGLPGTVGGAIYMNSKWTHPVSYIGDNLLSGRILTKEGNVVEKDKAYFAFSYGYSILQETKEILLSADFLLQKEDPEVLKERAQEALQYRKDTQPYGVATSGCYFKNVDGISAGKLIDEAGLKGTKIGGIEVSTKHANFLINDGTGTSEDLQKMIELIKNKVYEKSNINLKEEVILL